MRIKIKGQEIKMRKVVKKMSIFWDVEEALGKAQDDIVRPFEKIDYAGSIVLATMFNMILCGLPCVVLTLYHLIKKK